MAAITSDEAATAAADAVAAEEYLDSLRINKAIGQVQSAIGGSGAAMPAIAEEVEDPDLLTAEQQEVLDNLPEGEDSLVPTPPEALRF